MDKDFRITYGQGEGSIYTAEGKQRLLREEGIVFLDGAHAAKIIPRADCNPLVQILAEDDESLFSLTDSSSFDSHWIDNLIKVLEETKNEIEKRKLVVWRG